MHHAPRPTSHAPRITMTCPQCDLSNRPTARFCARCGTPLAALPASESPPPLAEGEALNGAGATPVEPVAPPAAALPPGPPPPAPLTPGYLVAERFEIVERLPAEGSSNLYAVHDLMACPHCGATNHPRGGGLCVECGRPLRGATPPVIRLLREAASAESLAEGPKPLLPYNGRFYQMLPILPAPPPGAARGLPLSAGYGSDPGMVRALNEDSLGVFLAAGVYDSVAAPTLGFFVVADGMGGHDAGEDASKQVVVTLAKHLLPHVLWPTFLRGESIPPERVLRRVEEAVQQANVELLELAQARQSDMGCTLTMALILNGVALIANVGDSRTYLWREGRLRQVTSDHSLVASLIAAGTVAPEDIYTHPDRNVVYRSMGSKATIEIDSWQEPLQPEDLLLLCCDGVWEALRHEGLEAVFRLHGDPQIICDELLLQANEAGGEDNLSAIVVRIGPCEKPG